MEKIDKYGVELELIMGSFKKNANEVKETMQQIGDSIKIKPDGAIMKMIDKTASNRFEKGLFTNVLGNLKENMEMMSGVNLEEEEFLDVLKDVNEEADKLEKKKGANLSNMFDNATKSLKKFAFSLFGIQSIWRVLSKASSAYLQQNKQLSNQMQAIWNSLGTLVAPVVEILVNVFSKLLGYLNVVTKALFNFDFIAKANANTLKNYQKQATKTSKALAGIDELTNINQQTDNQDDKGPALLEVPELDPKIVKFLQDMAKALKDNWDWISKVLIALGAVFGVSAVAGWVSNIAGLIGGSGIGLLGLAGALIWVYDIIKLQDLSKEWNELKKYRKELEKTNDKLHQGYMKNLKDRKEEAKTYEKGSQKMAQYVGMLKSNIEMNLADMESHDRKSKAYKRAEEEMKQNIKAYAELYKAGKLTDEQAKVYTETLLKLGYNANGVKLKTEEYRLVLKNLGFSEKEINDIISDNINKEHLQKEAIKQTTTATKDMTNQNKDAKTSTNDLGEALKNISSRVYKVIVDSKSTTNEAQTNINDMVNTIVEKFKNPFKIVFKSEVKSPTQQEIDNTAFALQQMVKKGISNVFKAVGLKVPGFAVGTDLVKSDGLAYIHRGEQIVPASAVSGGWTGSGNEKTNDLLKELIETLENKQFSASIGQDEVGRASVNYIRNQNRIMGGSVI